MTLTTEGAIYNSSSYVEMVCSYTAVTSLTTNLCRTNVFLAQFIPLYVEYVYAFFYILRDEKNWIVTVSFHDRVTQICYFQQNMIRQCSRLSSRKIHRNVFSGFICCKWLVESVISKNILNCVLKIWYSVITNSVANKLFIGGKM